MYKVGITGGIGSGKSTVCEMLAGRGVAVYTADERAKALMATDAVLRSSIIEAFGSDAYTAEGLNRGFLAANVFASPEALARLNGLVHPAVMADFEAWAEQQEGDYVVLESAILFEAALDDRVDVSVAVMAPEALRLERAMARDGASEEQIRARMRNQLSDEERNHRAKFTIVNIVLDDLEEDVEQLHRRLCYDARAAQRQSR
ncbi:MAG: dephospho-CoA kinase [Alistipes sp.]|nr:dephospho-CoA kinase [Alistipes sp.]